MARDLKVWGGRALYVDIRDRNDRGAQLRTVVVAYTKKSAVRLLDMTRSEFDRMWVETGNAEEVELVKHGEGVWRRVEKDSWRKISSDGYEEVARYG